MVVRKGEGRCNAIEQEIYKFKAKIVFQKYYNQDTQYGIYSFITNDEIPFYNDNPNKFNSMLLNNMTKNTKQCCIVGKMQELIQGQEYLIKAKYKKHKVYGHQYEVTMVNPLVPRSVEAQLLFLKSITSDTIAQSLLNAYPNIVNDVVNNNLEDIDYSKVDGVRELTWKKVKNKIIDHYLIADIIILLQPIGVTFTAIRSMLKVEPNPILLKEKILKNPYCLTRINGLGFKKVDTLALKLKPELLNSKERLIAFIRYYLTEIGKNEGHTWVSFDILKSEVSNQVSDCLDYMDELLEHNNILHRSGSKIGLKYYYEIEMKIIDLLESRISTNCAFQFNDKQIQEAIKQAETEQGFKYVDSQRKSIINTLKQNVSINIGEAGCGKTSIMRGILKAFSLNNYTISTSALSAMAAQRISDATGYPAKTIHRTLGCKGLNEFEYNKDNTLITSVAVLDEGSMVNAQLFLSWLEGISPKARLIICGDYRQLPPIGYGNIFTDIIKIFRNKIVNELKEPMRQSKNSGIITDARQIVRNRNPLTSDEKVDKVIHGESKDMRYIFRSNRESLYNIAIKAFLSAVQKDGLDNVVIAVPRKSNCINSAQNLNKKIQDLLLPNEIKVISNEDNIFKLGAKVMQITNDYEKNIFNGEIGYITNIKTIIEGKRKKNICEVTYLNTIGYTDEKAIKCITYEEKELNQIILAYAITLHKLQGAGRKTVIGIIDNTHYKLLDSCMLYTMLTRAKKRFLLLAEPSAFIHCIKKSSNRRNTWLSLKY